MIQLTRPIRQLKRTCLRPTADTGACSSSTASRLLDFRYTYRERAGAAGQGMNVDDLQETVTDKDNRLTLNCYDDLNCVRRVETGSVSLPPAACTNTTPGASSTDWFTYGYDLAGNLTASQRKGQTQQSMAYADGNRLCWKFTGVSSSSCATPPAGATLYTHDAAGQQTAGGGRSISYNARQQTTAFTGLAGLGYFGTGQSDLITAGGASHASGVLGLEQIGADRYTRDTTGALISQDTAAGHQYLQPDALGSVRATTNMSGAVVARLDYDPYGQTTSTTAPGPSTSRFGYAQGESMGAGVYHYGERYYDPAIARWTQPDPLLNASDIRQANRYGYVGGDPVNLIDPSGTSTVGNIAKGCAVSGAQSAGAAAVTGGGALAAGGVGCATGAAAQGFREAGCNACGDAVDFAGGVSDATKVGRRYLEKPLGSAAKSFAKGSLSVLGI